MGDFRLRFQGPAPVTLASLGDPRVARAMLALIGVAILAGILFGVIDVGHGFGGMLLALGPITAANSTEAKELAAQRFADAHALEDGEGKVAADDQEKYEALVAEGLEAEALAGKLAASEGVSETARERFEFYHGKGTGGGKLGWTSAQAGGAQPQTLGEAFVASKGYQALTESGALQSDLSKFRTDPVVWTPNRAGIQAAASDLIQTNTDGPANALVLPFRLPGILGLPQRELTLRDMFPVERMRSGDTIEYARQTAFDSGAAAVPQAASATDDTALKPQSSIAWEPDTAPVRTIATWMAATRQTLADADQVRSLIDNQGRLMLSLEEEDELVNGNGTAPHIRGIYATPGIHIYTPGDNLDGIRRARTKVKTGLSRLSASFVALEPNDSTEYDLLKDDFGQYRGGNPIGNFDFNQSIWRLRRVETEALAEGRAIVGAREAATIWERQPITVLTTDSHADFFVRNLVVILFEERIAFPIYFPSALVDLHLQAWASGS